MSHIQSHTSIWEATQVLCILTILLQTFIIMVNMFIYFYTYLQSCFMSLRMTATWQQLLLRTQRTKMSLIFISAKTQSSTLTSELLILYFHVCDFSKMTDKHDWNITANISLTAAVSVRHMCFYVKMFSLLKYKNLHWIATSK